METTDAVVVDAVEQPQEAKVPKAAVAVEIVKPTRNQDAWRMRAEDLVINWEENGRWKKPAIDEQFLQSLLAGQIQACGVVPVPGKSGAWKLAIGYRRALHVLEINRRGLLPQPMLLKVELHKGLNPEAAFLQNLRENKDRKNTNAVDDAGNIVKLHELFGWKDQAIGEFYGKTAAWVSKTRKILALPGKFLDLIEKGGLTAAQAEVLVDADEDFREKLYKEFKSGLNPSASDIKARAREEGATDTKRDASLKPKAITAFFEAIEEDEEAPEKLREFATVTLKWLRGSTRMGSSKYRGELEERLKLR